jgi:hypothetical protein
VWYRRQLGPEGFQGRHPLVHYVLVGWPAGLTPSEFIHDLGRTPIEDAEIVRRP